MIELTRFNGALFSLNPDMMLTVEATPDTIITLSDGQRFVVKEPVATVTQKIIAFRAAIQATALEYVARHQAAAEMTVIQEDPASAIPSSQLFRSMTGQE